MSIDTIVALLAKTTSENEHESKQALDAVWKRMKREGITLLDLLNQPKERLYQSSLMRIAELTALEKYPTQRIDRESFLSDLYLVVTAFFQQSTSEKPEGKGRKAEEESKADKAQRAYDQAQREREANNRRKQAEEQQPPPKDSPKTAEQDTATPFWRKVLIPHPAYFRDTIYQELSHNFTSVAILFLATLCSGILCGFFLSGIFIYFGSLQVGIVVRYIGLYIGAIGSLNFYLWKHRGFRWDH
jgi:hypothetical protein